MSSLLLLVALFASDLSSASGQEAKTAFACQGRDLRMSCDAGYVIRVEHVIVADSGCYGTHSCCPNPSDCTDQPQDAHRNTVLRTCNDRQLCTFRATKQLTSCRVLGIIRVHNDYELVTYKCIDVNECLSTYSGKSCSPNATCTNTRGSFSCHCKPGFEGNGLSCRESWSSPASQPTITKDVSSVTSTYSIPTMNVLDDHGVEVASLLAADDKKDDSITGAMTSTQVMLVVVGVVGLVLILVTLNVVLWCRLKQQRRRRRVSERQLQLTLRRGTGGGSSAGACGADADDDSDGRRGTCGSRPAAVVGQQQCSETACGGQQVRCGDDVRINGIDTSARQNNANVYEKLDYVTVPRKPDGDSCAQSTVDYRMVSLPPIPVADGCCAKLELAKNCSDDFDMDCCYDDLDEYLKPSVGGFP